MLISMVPVYAVDNSAWLYEHEESSKLKGFSTQNLTEHDRINIHIGLNSQYNVSREKVISAYL